jgi:hypothetical protein
MLRLTALDARIGQAAHAPVAYAHSHSIVAGGLLDTS